MRVQEAERLVIESGGSIDVFHKWMAGQTCGINSDGTSDIYDYDVHRFIRYNCRPND